MPRIKAFRALRPTPEMAYLVSTRSYDKNHNDLSKNVIQNNQYSYLHVTKPHLYFDDEFRDAAKHYPYALQKFNELKKDGNLVKDDKPSMYFHLMFDKIRNIEYYGLVALCSVQDYLDGKIKVHEKTLTKREDGIIEHIGSIKAVGEPILLAFKNGYWLDDLKTEIIKNPPLYNFVSDSGKHHQLWVINDEKIIEKIESEEAKLSEFYIADGHHRIGATSRYAQQQGFLETDKENPANFVLSFFIPEHIIKVFEFNRLVKDLNGMEVQEFLDKLKTDFQVHIIGQSNINVKKKKYQFGLFVQDKWYGLDFKKDTKTWNILDRLDVSILEKYILKPILGIKDSKTDDRLSFLDGTKKINALQDFVNNGKYACAFSLHPIPIKDVFEVADEGLTMPPKSTWFEPKLRTGLIINEI